MQIKAIKSRGAFVWFTLIALIIAIASGLLIHLIRGSTESQTPAQSVEAKAIQTQEKWYLWLGTARASEMSFASSSECEEYRRRAFLEVQASAGEAMNQVGAISGRQIQELGFNPRERIEAYVVEAGKAICRSGAD